MVCAIIVVEVKKMRTKKIIAVRKRLKKKLEKNVGTEKIRELWGRVPAEIIFSMFAFIYMAKILKS